MVIDKGGTFFHRHVFLSTLAEGLGFSLDLRTVTIAGTPVGVAPILFTRRGPFTNVNRLPFPYVGPLVPAQLLTSTMAALSRRQRRIRALWSEHVLPTHQPEPVPGYESSAHSTFVVPVKGRSDEDLLKGMSSRRRAAVRRAERGGLRVRQATESEITELLPTLSGRTFQRQGLLSQYPPGVFRLVWDRLRGNPDVLFQTADIEGTPVAVQISFAGGPTGLAWVVGRQPDQTGSDAYAGMMWHTMCWARDRGCRDFDLVGAPTEGIANYKRGLGAEERIYTVLRHRTRARRGAEHLAGHLRRAQDTFMSR